MGSLKKIRSIMPTSLNERLKLDSDEELSAKIITEFRKEPWAIEETSDSSSILLTQIEKFIATTERIDCEKNFFDFIKVSMFFLAILKGSYKEVSLFPLITDQNFLSLFTDKIKRAIQEKPTNPEFNFSLKQELSVFYDIANYIGLKDKKYLEAPLISFIRETVSLDDISVRDKVILPEGRVTPNLETFATLFYFSEILFSIINFPDNVIKKKLIYLGHSISHEPSLPLEKRIDTFSEQIEKALKKCVFVIVLLKIMRSGLNDIHVPIIFKNLDLKEKEKMSSLGRVNVTCYYYGTFTITTMSLANITGIISGNLEILKNLFFPSTVQRQIRLSFIKINSLSSHMGRKKKELFSLKEKEMPFYSPARVMNMFPKSSRFIHIISSQVAMMADVLEYFKKISTDGRPENISGGICHFCCMFFILSAKDKNIHKITLTEVFEKYKDPTVLLSLYDATHALYYKKSKVTKKNPAPRGTIDTSRFPNCFYAWEHRLTKGSPEVTSFFLSLNQKENLVTEHLILDHPSLTSTAYSIERLPIELRFEQPELPTSLAAIITYIREFRFNFLAYDESDTSLLYPDDLLALSFLSVGYQDDGYNYNHAMLFLLSPERIIFYEPNIGTFHFHLDHPDLFKTSYYDSKKGLLQNLLEEWMIFVRNWNRISRIDIHPIVLKKNAERDGFRAVMGPDDLGLDTITAEKWYVTRTTGQFRKPKDPSSLTVYRSKIHSMSDVTPTPEGIPLGGAPTSTAISTPEGSPVPERASTPLAIFKEKIAKIEKSLMTKEEFESRIKSFVLPIKFFRSRAHGSERFSDPYLMRIKKTLADYQNPAIVEIADAEARLHSLELLRELIQLWLMSKAYAEKSIVAKTIHPKSSKESATVKILSKQIQEEKNLILSELPA